jgi:hypothetical protein
VKIKPSCVALALRCVGVALRCVALRCVALRCVALIALRYLEHCPFLVALAAPMSVMMLAVSDRGSILESGLPLSPGPGMVEI